MKIEKMSDEKVLEKFIELLETRVSITTGFAKNDDDNDANFTHQFLTITCGDKVLVSNPEPLDVPLRAATGAELGATVN
jgi:hypothetical protein